MTAIPRSIDDNLMYKIATMYYTEELSQAQIAKRVQLSRPQVSRYLKRARETGMVEIKLNEPSLEKTLELADKLKSFLRLKEAVVSPLESHKNCDKERLLESIALKAGSYLPLLLRGSKVVGVGWGRTLYRTILSMNHHRTERSLLFVPLIGGIGQTAPFYQVNNMVDRLAEKFDAARVFLNLPAFSMAGELYRTEAVGNPFEAIDEYWSKLDLAIVGLGGPTGTLSTEIEPAIVEKLKSEGAVGDILGQFFKADGKICVSGMEENLAGLPIERLTKVEDVVCLSGGNEKIRGIVAAARAGYFNVLVTDELTARGILQTPGGD